MSFWKMTPKQKFVIHWLWSLTIILMTWELTARSGESMDYEKPPHVADYTVFIESNMVLSNQDWLALGEAEKEALKIRPPTSVSGSGFIVHQDGLIVTNYHVIGNYEHNLTMPNGRAAKWTWVSTSLKVVVKSGLEGEEVYWPKIRKTDQGNDLTLLKISPRSELRPLVINPYEKVRQGAGLDVWVPRR
jgi:S1-C subfamily serine protease